jgi:hypothetical protein
MTKHDPFAHPDQLKLPSDWLPKYAEPFKPVPEKIRKRREQFVQVPMWWIERLGDAPAASGKTILVALHLWHLDYKHHGKPFALANGMLKYDGVSRDSKYDALNDLERRGLIRVERRVRKSPIIHLIREPVCRS